MANGPARPDFSVLGPASSQSTSPTAGSTFRRARRGTEMTANWLGDRVGDAGLWLATLVRYLPVRIGRLFLTLAAAVLSLLKFWPSAMRVLRADPSYTRPFLAGCAGRAGTLALQLVLGIADLIGAPEIFAFLWRMVTHVSPLDASEIAAASEVLGPDAVRYQDIRIAQGGVLKWVFARNGQRAFATFHTINLPQQGRHQRDNIDIVVHEIVHVYQYERAGSRYFAEALVGQREAGYDYGGPEGLIAAVRQGRRLSSFNREQQAQIAQDYFAATRNRVEAVAYEPFIRQLREGQI